MDLFKQLFLIKLLKGTNINKNCFSPQSEPQSEKLCFTVILKHFRGNSQRTSLFSPKSDYLRKRTEIRRKFVFLNKFENGPILKKIWICLNNFF